MLMLFYRSELRVSEVLALRVAKLGRAPTWLIRAPGAQARLASSLALPSNQDRIDPAYGQSDEAHGRQPGAAAERMLHQVRHR